MSPVLMWIGLGSIGRSACISLTTHADLASPLLIHNRTPQRAHDLAAHHLPPGTAQVAPTLADGLRRADIIFTCVSDDAAVRQTYAALAAAADDDLAGKILVATETVAPATADEVEALVRARGGSFVACPVLGPPAAAEAGLLLAIPAGPAGAIEAIMPYLTGGGGGGTTTTTTRGVLARALVGPFPDRPAATALRMKIVANTFTLGAAAQLAEAFALAEACGLGAEAVRRYVDLCLVAAPPATNPFHVYSGRMLRGEYYRETSTGATAAGAAAAGGGGGGGAVAAGGGGRAGAVGLGLKDARHALEMAEGCGVEVRIPAVVVYWADKVVAYQGRGGGLEDGDIAGMYGAVRMEAGLDFENGVL